MLVAEANLVKLPGEWDRCFNIFMGGVAFPKKEQHPISVSNFVTGNRLTSDGKPTSRVSKVTHYYLDFGWHANVHQYLTTTVLESTPYSHTIFSGCSRQPLWEWGYASGHHAASRATGNRENGACFHTFWRLQTLWKDIFWSCFKYEGLVRPGATSICLHF